MSPSNPTLNTIFFFFFFFFALFSLSNSESTPTPSPSSPLLFHICFGKQNYTVDSPFASTLTHLLTRLTIKTPPTGFSLASGRGLVHGLALCRGDAPREACKACVVAAGQELRSACPFSKGAVIWYDDCLLKYSDESFFRKIDSANRFALLNVQAIAGGDPAKFDARVNGLLSGLARQASASGPGLFYAVGEVGLDGEAGPDRKLYGLAQCTRDLSGPDCKTCLDNAIGGLPSCCGGKRGGRVVTGSCYVRYELYPIVRGQI